MLRRLVYVCLTVSISLCVLMCFSACNKTKPPKQPVTTGFECDVDVQYKDMNVKGHLTRSSAGTLRMDITEPATIKGLSMEWNGEDITVKLHGLSFGVDPKVIPQSALGKNILNALDTALSIRDGSKLTDEGLSTKGKSVGGEFEIMSDPSTGNLLSLNSPSLEMTATFSNFTVK